ncbi:MAG: phasin family protein [Variovorax sp.]|nr:phasin family protein [Variovorax sp.]
MATRRDGTENVNKKEKAPSAARKTAPARNAVSHRKPMPTAPVVPEAPAQDTGGASALLRAGLQALGNVHDDVVKHQTNVVETLLGMPKTGGGRSATARAFPALDVGLRKFEDVFDQRVASAMERLGLPSVQQLDELREQVRLLQKRIDRLEHGEASVRRKR